MVSPTLLPRGRLKMDHEVDPKEDLLSKVDLTELELDYNHVVVAIYQRPMRTVGGIILTDKQRDEDIWQGKVGLVVKLGSQAYVDSEDFKFNGVKHDVGEWVFFYPQNGRAIEINGTPCRIFRDTDILGRIPDPDYVF